MTFSKIYEADELFEDIPGDPDNVLFKIPPEMLEKTGWKEGDTIHVSIENESVVIKKHG